MTRRSERVSERVSERTVGGRSGGRGAERDAGRAGACGADCEGNLVTIKLYVQGDEVIMTSCSSCDRRSWRRGGRPVELRTLLADIAAQRAALRRAS